MSSTDITSPSSVIAVTLRSEGMVDLSTAREWYLPTTVLGDTPRYIAEPVSTSTSEDFPCISSGA